MKKVVFAVAAIVLSACASAPEPAPMVTEKPAAVGAIGVKAGVVAATASAATKP